MSESSTDGIDRGKVERALGHLRRYDRPATTAGGMTKQERVDRARELLEDALGGDDLSSTETAQDGGQ